MQATTSFAYSITSAVPVQSRAASFLSGGLFGAGIQANVKIPLPVAERSPG
jgi:hypothetical protein